MVRTARGRNWIVFSGTAAQAENAFQTQIHTFNVKGEIHFANTTPAAIPAALSGIVAGIRGLSDFRPKSHAVHSNPDYTLPLGNNQYNFFLAPGDIATMYDIGPLYTAGIDGTGMTLAVMGQTDVYLNDLAYFRSGFGLSPINCTTNAHNVITACNTSNFKYVYIDAIADPGTPNTVGQHDLPEADIDLEWSGAAARNAQIIYVNAPDPNGGGVWDSWYYAVDNTVAPVITLSYGLCELAEAYDTGTGEFTFSGDEAELQKANSEGITFMNSSADQGAANCDYGSNYAVNGYAVSYPASSPEVTGVGGTLIPSTEYTATYWNTTNGTDGGSAKSYIPEQGWNDAEEIGAYCVANPTNSFCTGNSITDWASAQSVIGIWASGGGVSNCVSIDVNGVCQSGFPQPSWQAGLNASAINPGGFGVTTTPTRFSPDVSLMASIYWPGYLLCTAADEVGGTGTTSSCSPGGAQGIINDQTIYGYSWGGTSVAAPIFAGIVTLLNQQVVASGIQTTPGLGNINPMLYTLAAANSTNKAFNPVTTPNTGAYSDGAWCSPGTPTSGVTADPWPTALQCPTSGFLGFSAFNFDATTNYNLVTGLGSVDVGNLFAAWIAAGSATTTTLISSPNPANFGASVTFTATVTTVGTHPPTGTVTFNDGTASLGTGTLNGSQVATFPTSSLTVGTHSITAVYGGDANNAGSTSAVLSQVIVAPAFAFSIQPSTPAPAPAGESTTSTFTVTPTGTTTFPITFACNLPSGIVGVSCSFNPTQIATGASGAQPVTLTISTTGPNKPTGQPQRRADNRSPWLPLALPLAGVVMVGLAGWKMSKYSAIVGLCALLVLIGLLVACGSSSTPPVGISVSPSGATVFAGCPTCVPVPWPPQTASFTATVTNSTNTAVTWAVTTANGGSITSGGVYTAPPITSGPPASATVTATSQADPTKVATATVTITPTTVPGAYNLTVTATEGPTQVTTSNIALTVQ